MRRIIVIGGGAAGMAAAIACGEAGAPALLLEKNEKLGKKLYITGKGRCNVTNACAAEEFFGHVATNARFLYSAFYGFTNRDMTALLEECGCPLKTERGGRVFPVSDKASDVTAALSGRLRKLKTDIRLNEEVKELWIEDGRLQGVILKKGNRKMAADAVIIATGGLSYPTTGSTGDGYRMAAQAGHRVTELSPALAPFETSGDVGKSLQGLALKNIEAAVLDGKKEIYREFGEMLFTHFGVSGPVILSASS